MPDPIIPGAEVAADLSQADAAAEALLRSANANTTMKPDVSPARMDELDRAFEEVAGKKPGEDVVAPANDAEAAVGRENGGVKPALPGGPTDVEKQAAADAKAAKDAADAEAATKAAAEAEAKKKLAAEKKPKGLLGDLVDGEESTETPAADDPTKAYDDIKLRPDASDKTKESFANQRARAIERETAVSTKLQAEQAKRLELETEITELKKTTGKLTPEVETELKELREFRAVHDVESRPEFREKYNARITANDDAIYTFFKAQQMPEERINQLKALPEDARLEYIEKHVLPKLSTVQRRFVEAKLIDNVQVADERQKALAAARTDADKILAASREAPLQERIARDTAIANVVRQVLPKLPYLHEVEIPTTATPAEKAQLEARNKFALELQGNLKQGIIDDSPTVRAEAALAIPIAKYLSRELKTAVARAEAAEAKLAAIQKAGAVRRLGTSAAIPGAPAPVAPKLADASSDIVDRLFAENGGKL